MEWLVCIMNYLQLNFHIILPKTKVSLEVRGLFTMCLVAVDIYWDHERVL